jgi:hypothetical protein
LDCKIGTAGNSANTRGTSGIPLRGSKAAAAPPAKHRISSKPGPSRIALSLKNNQTAKTPRAPSFQFSKIFLGDLGALAVQKILPEYILEE